MSKLSPSASPTLRFNGFSKDWALNELGDYLTFKNGINADKESYGSGYKFINVLDIINNDFITNDSIIGSVNVDKKTFDKNEVSYGDILFQRSSENREEAGQSNVYLDRNKTSCFGGFVIRGKAQKQYNPVYLNFLLKSDLARKEIVTKSGGSTRYNVGQDSLAEVKFYISSDETEQQKIADFLSSVDKKISLLKDKHALLTQYKKGVMQKLFKQKIRFKDDNGNDFPDWETLKVKDVTTNFSKRNKQLVEAEVYSVTNSKGFIPQSEQFEGQVAGEDLANYKIVTTGDFAYNPARINVGSIAQFHGETAVISSLYVCFKTNSNICDRFFTHWLQLDKTKFDINRFGEGGVRIYLWYPLFSMIPISLPVYSEQKKIADLLDSLDKKLDSINQQIELTQTFKKGLLQQMFV
ncbi:restriction endonuclease subunit S [Neptuniibacter sp. QD37_11]|uniref:restriction endonuclease subunit S n=1 Tax=Neptuniibacter sp. QD37_11 TaxID=3398209 RepID=UPI0039F52522